MLQRNSQNELGGYADRVLSQRTHLDHMLERGFMMKDQYECVPYQFATAIQPVLRELIRDIKERELESGRNLAFEELRPLQLDPRLIDRMLRQVAEARSTDELVASLESFVNHHEPLARVKEWVTTSRQHLKALCWRSS